MSNNFPWFTYIDLYLPQVDHFCAATAVQGETKSRNEQREEKYNSSFF